MGPGAILAPRHYVGVRTAIVLSAVGLEVMSELIQAQVTDLAGIKGRHAADRSHKRHGGESGSVTLGGRRLPVRRPRVRPVGDDER